MGPGALDKASAPLATPSLPPSSGACSPAAPLRLAVPPTGVVKTKCGLSKPCPNDFFAFKISSGAANVVGPTVCFENLV